MAYIKGVGETARVHIIQAFVQREAELQYRVWFGRVPSFSNPSDAPSRMDFRAVVKEGATRTRVPWEKVVSHLGLGCGAELGRC